MTIQNHTAFLICPTNRATLAEGTPPECGEAGRHIKKEWISVFDAALAGLHEDIRGDQCLHGSGNLFLVKFLQHPFEATGFSFKCATCKFFNLQLSGVRNDTSPNPVANRALIASKRSSCCLLGPEMVCYL